MRNFEQRQEINDDFLNQMTADFEQQKLGELMALDCVKAENPDVFKRDIGDIDDYDIYVEGETKQAEIASIQACQNHEQLSEDIQQQGHNTPENRKQLAQADQYAIKIESMVRDIIQSDSVSIHLGELNERKDIILSYDVPAGYESIQKEALQYIFQAQKEALEEHNHNESYGRVYEEHEMSHLDKAIACMEQIEAEIDRLYQIEKYGDFGDMRSEEIQEYATSQLDIAQEKLFDENVSNEEAIKGLYNALEAMKQLPGIIEQEEQEAMQDAQDMDRSYWNMAGENLTDTQKQVGGLLKRSFPQIDPDCIDMIYAETPEDYDRVEQNVAAFAAFLKQSGDIQDQKSLFDDFFYQEQPEALHSKQLYTDLSEDFPNIEKYLIPALCQKAHSIDEVMDRVNDFSLYIDAHKGHSQDELFAAFVSGQELPKTLFQSLKDRFFG